MVQETQQILSMQHNRIQMVLEEESSYRDFVLIFFNPLSINLYKFSINLALCLLLIIDVFVFCVIVKEYYGRVGFYFNHESPSFSNCRAFSYNFCERFQKSADQTNQKNFRERGEKYNFNGEHLLKE